MKKKSLKKPDGRNLTLYSRREIPDGMEAPSPRSEPVNPNPHLRWHPLRGEWITYAAHRQDRTFLPPPEYNPLAQMTDPRYPTELPAGDYDVAVFDNLFPSMAEGAHSPPQVSVPTMPANGICEVVVFSQNPKDSLGRLDLDHIKLILDVWADRYTELSKHPQIKYVLPFENRGVEVGVTLHHPHGQIYAYPFVPPVPQRMLSQARGHFEKHGRTLLSDMIAIEVDQRQRLIYEGPHAVAFVPPCARYSYEVWIAPKRAAPSLAALTDDERVDLARALKTVLLTYDGLWQRPFPYLMAVHQAPLGGDTPYAHMHIEFSPPYRTKDRLKYLAGTELAAGMFASDSLPEDKAKELQAVVIESF